MKEFEKEDNVEKNPFLVTFIKNFGFFFSLDTVARNERGVQEIMDSQLLRIGVPLEK